MRQADPPQPRIESSDDGSPDLANKIRLRREELFGPKPGTPSRQTIDVRARALEADPTHPATIDYDGLDLDDIEETSTTHAKHEMELGAHTETPPSNSSPPKKVQSPISNKPFEIETEPSPSSKPL